METLPCLRLADESQLLPTNYRESRGDGSLEVATYSRVLGQAARTTYTRVSYYIRITISRSLLRRIGWGLHWVGCERHRPYSWFPRCNKSPRNSRGLMT